jgi:hypothetical protein
MDASKLLGQKNSTRPARNSVHDITFDIFRDICEWLLVDFERELFEEMTTRNGEAFSREARLSLGERSKGKFGKSARVYLERARDWLVARAVQASDRVPTRVAVVEIERPWRGCVSRRSQSGANENPQGWEFARPCLGNLYCFTLVL